MKNPTEFYAELFRHYTPPAPLCFDVGAHEGHYTQGMLNGGAGMVIAVEPNPRALRELVERLCPHRRLIIEPRGVDADSGTHCLHVSDRHSQLSSMSPSFIEASREPRDYWNATIAVPCISLSELADRYGTPEYIKLDIEGFEAAALGGLDWAPELVSFEVHAWLREAADDCLTHLHQISGGAYQFNMVEGGGFDWMSERPLNDQEVLDNLPGWGDVYAWRRD